MTPVSNSHTLLRCHPQDNVAIALADLPAAADASDGAVMVRLRDPVGRGHKVAVAAIAAGEAVVRYGAMIGRACCAIAPGSHVHTHNLATALTGEVDYRRVPAGKSDRGGTDPHAPASRMSGTWRGYRRKDGRAATRNEVWILPTVGCVAPLAEEAGRLAHARHAGRIDGVFGFGHPHGCSQLGDDLSGTRALLAGLADNPNAGGVLLLGLGCESNQVDALLAAIPERSRTKVRVLRAQEPGDEMVRTQVLLDELVDQCAGATRTEMPPADLVVGLKCGGSDSWSGLTANPLLGLFSDALAAAGGKLLLTEIPEIFGAEADLLDRASSTDVRQQAEAMLNRFKRYFLDQGQPVSDNPSPGNIAGGITTLEEKSLGAVQKAGRVPLVDVLGYGAAASKAGLTLLEAPGNDAVSATALVAAGATVVLFTTGRGTPLGFPAPTIKVASTSDLADRKAHWIDFDAGAMLGPDRSGVCARFSAYVAAVASGEATASERAAQRSIAIWKRGVTL
ncbi:MAG: UxaA family hydrolase [Alteraurantiacibacter sp.]